MISVFDPFGDYESAGYLRNALNETDLHFVKKMEHDAFLSNLPKAIQYLSQIPTLDYQALLQTHHIIFKELYPWAGQDRLVTTPNNTVRKGQIVFANPEDIETTVNRALNANVAGDVLGGLALAHPFLDGNGRAMAVFFSEHQLRQDKVVRWDTMPRSEYLNALGQAIMTGTTPLNDLLRQHSTRVKRRSPSSLEILSNINWSGRRVVPEAPKSLMARLFKS